MRTTFSHPNRLRQRRLSAGFTQIQLVVESGVSLATINRLENHPLQTTFQTAQRLAAALDCRVEDIFPFLDDDQNGGRHGRK
jgi:transcriptional regulator with XRE-family HTH domain